MKGKRTLFILAAVLGVAIIAAGVWLYDWVLGDTLEASQPISAVPLPSDTSTPLPAPTTAVVDIEPVQETEPVTIETTVPTQETVTATSELRYTISQNESQARFTIFEELNGQPTDVVGSTNQVAGEAAIDLSDLSQTRLGTITVNARTLVTAEDRRNQAIRNRILHTDQYEYVTFTPQSLVGLSGSAEPGQTYTFQIYGDLNIQDVTQPAVFDATVSVESAERIRGIATTTISRSDFNLQIPNVPFVANVGENVILEIEFVIIPAT